MRCTRTIKDRKKRKYLLRQSRILLKKLHHSKQIRDKKKRKVFQIRLKKRITLNKIQKDGKWFNANKEPLYAPKDFRLLRKHSIAF